MTCLGEKRFATGLTLRTATVAARTHAAAAIGRLGVAPARPRCAALLSRLGRNLSQSESSKQASAGMIVSQLRKERLPLRIRTAWNMTMTPPAT